MESLTTLLVNNRCKRFADVDVVVVVVFDVVVVNGVLVVVDVVKKDINADNLQLC